jgi:arylsulfatase A-like enzyme
MKRREFIKSSAIAAAGMGLGSGMASASQDRPNVLVILVDQWRMPKWTPLLQTPNIDRLAAQGVTFNNHFVSASPCSPSRACLVTGTYTTQNKMYTNCDFVEGDLQPSLDPGIPTFGHVFGKAGYKTPYRGKWHMTRRKDRNRKDPLLDYGFTGWNPPDAMFGGPPYSGAVQDPSYTRQTVQWISDPENKKDPWFMVCSLVNPHDICAYPRYYPQRKLRQIRTEAPPPNWTDDLTGKPGCQKEYQKKYNTVGGPMDLTDADQWRRYLDYYMFCIEDADANIGLVLDALEKSGQANNTIVLFTADHGEMGGSHRLRTKGCFAYEEEINVPLIVSAPGRIPKGVTTDAFASNVDAMPTLVSMAGLTGTLPYMPGKDLSPVLENPAGATVQDHVIFHQDWEVQFTIGKKPGQAGSFKNPAHIRCIRDHEWKYSYYFKPGTDEVEHELYNMKDDPMEMVNLGNDPAYKNKRKELYEHLMEREQKLDEEFEV